MKKYFILGILLVIIGLMLSFSFKQVLTADDKPTVFYGTAKAGKTVTACLDCEDVICYSAVAGSNNMYYIKTYYPVSGSYCITDVCWWTGATYSGTPVRVDFCVGTPGNPCKCN